jgi:DNA-binding NtrC family response regulator
MHDATALLTTRDPTLSRSVEKAVGSVSHLRLATVPTLADALEALRQPDLALVLVHLAGAADAQRVAGLLREMAAARRPVPTLVIGEPYDAEQAFRLLRLGAADYLERPLDLRRLGYLLDVLTVRVRHAPRPAAPAPSVESLGDGSFIYSPAAAMGKVMEQVRRVAPQDVNILLGGETGTGKTRLARLIHELSPRREQPFLTVNCGSLSASLIESEMFGHVRGAFTGADRNRTGKFAEAGRGTILLDDIDALPVALQAKLLRVIEERVFEAVGSNTTVPLQARLVVASNRALDREVAAGRFRADLYYRLNVVAFFLPPLRERGEMLPAMVERFIATFAAQNGRPVKGIAPVALRALQEYPWPGNIRELRNVIERAVALCPGEHIGVEDLPEAVLGAALPAASPAPALPPAAVPAPALPQPGAPPRATLAEAKETAEADRIREALARHKNNRLRAAAELGVSRMTLYKKLHQYGLMGLAG